MLYYIFLIINHKLLPINTKYFFYVAFKNMLYLKFSNNCKQEKEIKPQNQS